ncbi:MAG: hypothetical protein JWO57_4544 [Pseudonocardiales bacterium]|nr:hypothetical protein [Pseudonocardiales bacterium]
MTALITEGLFRVDGERAVLFASRRRSSGVVKFPAERSELFDGDADIQDDIEAIELSTEGTLYTYTTQDFAPPLPYRGHRTPDKFRPYVVGFVELAEGVLVETLILAAASDLRIGQRMVSTITTLETADGEELLTYAFRPWTIERCQFTTTRAESGFGIRRDVAATSPSRWDSTSAVGHQS